MAKYKYIQEAISTDDGTAGSLLISKKIHDQLIEEIDKRLIPRELASMYVGPSQIKGSSFIWNGEEFNAMGVKEVNELGEIPKLEPGYETNSITPVKYGLRIEISQEMIEDGKWGRGLFDRAVRQAAKRFAENETELILEQLDNASNTVSGGANVTIANLVRAKQYLEDEDYEPTDCICGIEFANDLIQIDTFTEVDKSGSREVLNKGFLGDVFGIRFYRFSTNAAPSSTYSKYGYIIDRDWAYLIAEKRTLQQKAYTLETHDLEGVALTQRIAVKYRKADAIAKITTT